MENQIYRLNLENRINLELYITGSNKLDSHRSIREMAVQIIVGERQLDASIAEYQLESLIKYLTDCKDYIKKYNEVSIPHKE